MIVLFLFLIKGELSYQQYFEQQRIFIPFAQQQINRDLSHWRDWAALILLNRSNLDPAVLKNYHLVSNLPFLSKVLQHVVLAQLITHLGTHNHLEPFQSAYWKRHSTETALLHVVNNLLKASGDGHVSILSLFDLSAASDMIDHVILSQWLSSTFGCTETELITIGSKSKLKQVSTNSVVFQDYELSLIHIWRCRRWP